MLYIRYLYRLQRGICPSNVPQMSITIRYKKITGSRSSIYLDSPALNPRKKYLGEFVYDKPKTNKEKEHNRNIMAVVEQVKFDLETKLRNSKHRIIEDRSGEDFVKYFEWWMKNINPSDPRKAIAVLNKFKSYLQREGKRVVYGYQITEQLCEDFAAYLKKELNGSSPRTYWVKFKTCLKRAYKDSLIPFNPRDLIINLPVDNAITKPLLNEDEIKLLASATTENKIVKQAYFVSLLVGFDFATIKQLEPSHFDMGSNEICYERSKVERNRRKPMSSSVRSIIEERLRVTSPGEKMFPIGSYNGCMKTLRAMARRVGITKKITWHSARHSFATNLLKKDVDIRIISDLLDHKDLKTTMRYTEVVNVMRIKALEKLDDVMLSE